MEREFKKGDSVLIETTVTKISDYNTIQIETGTFSKNWLSNKIIKHAEPEFVPRDMMVWNKEGDIAQKRFISGIFDGWYMYKEEWGGYYSYRNAKEMPQELEKVSDEQLLKTFEAWLKQIKK